MLDFLHPDTHPAIKKIKDIAGAAVILSSVGLLILGLIIIINFFSWVKIVGLQTNLDQGVIFS